MELYCLDKSFGPSHLLQAHSLGTCFSRSHQASPCPTSGILYDLKALRLGEPESCGALGVMPRGGDASEARLMSHEEMSRKETEDTV